MRIESEVNGYTEYMEDPSDAWRELSLRRTEVIRDVFELSLQ